ncbi:MAG: TonB-dependent receptor, partial [Verrucomicrobiota bacterium]
MQTLPYYKTLAFIIVVTVISPPAYPFSKEQEDEPALTYARLPTAILVGTRTEVDALDVAGSVSSYSSDDLAFIGTRDFDDFLEAEPLVSATFDFSAADPTVPYNSGGSSSYTIRGVGGNRVAIFLDGIRQPLEVDFQVGGIAINGAGRDYFDPAIFRSVEIFKGTASSLYGSDALAGVVSFTTPEPLDFVSQNSGENFFGYHFQYSSASENYSNVFSSAVNSGPFSALVIYARRDYSERENMAEPVNGVLPSPNPVDAESDSILAKVDYYVTDEHTLQFTAEGFFRETVIDVDSVEGTENRSFSLDLTPVGLPPSGNIQFFSGTATTEDAISENDRERYRFSVEHIFESDSGGVDELSTLIYHQYSKTEDFYSDRFVTENFLNIAPAFNYSTESSSTVDTSYEEITTGLTSTYIDTFDFSQSSHRILLGFDGSFGHSELPFTANGQSQIVESTLNDFEGFQQQDEPEIADTIRRPRLPKTETLRLGVFLQDEITFGAESEWILVAGLRADYYSLESEEDEDFRNFVGVEAPDYEDFSISPSISLLRRIGDNASVFGSYRNGFRNPTPVEISGGFVHPPGADFRTAPNPDLKAEKSHAFEIGSKYDSGRIRVNASLFYTFYEDFINFPTPTDEFVQENGRNFRLYKPQNIDSVDVYGFEVSAEASLGLLASDFEDWYLGTSFGRAFGKQEDDDLDDDGFEEDGEEPLVTVDPFQWNHYLDYRGEKIRARLIGIYVDEKTQLGESNLIPTTSYYVVNFRVSYEFSDNLRFGFGVNNLTDKKYTRWQSVQNNIHGSRQDQLELFQRASEPGR